MKKRPKTLDEFCEYMAIQRSETAPQMACDELLRAIEPIMDIYLKDLESVFFMTPNYQSTTKAYGLTRLQGELLGFIHVSTIGQRLCVFNDKSFCTILNCSQEEFTEAIEKLISEEIIVVEYLPIIAGQLRNIYLSPKIAQQFKELESVKGGTASRSLTLS